MAGVSELVTLTAEHLADFSIPDLPGDEWFGAAAVDADGRTLGVGVIFNERGRAWALVAGKVPRMAHRLALRVLSDCAEVGLEVWAECDPEIAGAEKWMRRLGFVSVGNGEWKRGRSG